MTSKQQTRLLARLLKLKARAKALYDQADGTMAKLLPGVAVGDVITVAEGESYVLKDNFAETNIAWSHGSVRRFDFAKVKAPKA